MLSKTKSLVRKIQKHYFPQDWPRPDYSKLEHEPTFLFVFTPPYSGSTALVRILNSAHASMTLQHMGEGEWLVPGLNNTGRWEPTKEIDWESVKAVWFNKVRSVEELTGRVDLVIEKSPPNLCRADLYLKHFPKHQIIVLNRNPYANCASNLYRSFKPQTKTEDERIGILKQLADNWITRATYARNIIQNHDTLAFTYEEFCQDVEATVAKMTTKMPLLQGISAELEVKVKDYPRQKISNQNSRQIGKLSEKEIKTIADLFKPHEELLNSFGYTSDEKQDVKQGGASNVDEHAAADSA